MKLMLRVSVVMATFNGSRFIGAQLASLAHQRELPAELIISDDCSSDDTISIAKEFANISPFPVRIVINETRKGYRKNFIDATALCSSELIAFCDQDDIWHADKLFCITHTFSADKDIILVYHNARVVDLHGAFVRRLLPHEPPTFICQPLSLGPLEYALGFTQVFRRSLLDFLQLNSYSMDQNCPDVTLAHDQWFFFLASVFGKIAYLERDLVEYRQHDMNVFGAPPVEGAIKRSVIENISLRLEHHKDFARRAAFADNRVFILNKIGLDKQYQQCICDKALAGVRKYQSLSDLFRLRAKIYQESWFANRVVAWANMVRRGGYVNSSWTFSKRSAVRDVLLGVCCGPKLNWLAILVRKISDAR
jgi:glycosyltransferase involved in cell wall biosynthesis